MGEGGRPGVPDPSLCLTGSSDPPGDDLSHRSYPSGPHAGRPGGQERSAARRG